MPGYASKIEVRLLSGTQCWPRNKIGPFKGCDDIGFICTWASELDLPRDFETKIVRYTTFSQAIGAAVSGAGVALGRSPLIDPELGSGRLVRLVPGLSRPA